MTEDEIIQNRITSLIALRQSMMQTVTVLVGGVVGLIFIPDSPAKYVVIALGVMYAVMLIKKLQSVIAELGGYLYKNKGSNYYDKF